MSDNPQDNQKVEVPFAPSSNGYLNREEANRDMHWYDSDELPQNSIGKVLKKELRERFATLTE